MLISDATWIIGLLILGVLVIGAILAFVHAQRGREDEALELPPPAVRERNDLGVPDVERSDRA